MKFTIFVTQKCNLRCKYCYEGDSKINKDMTFDIADKTVKFISNKVNESSDNEPLYIVFHGGEPLLNFKIIKYIYASILETVKDKEIIFDMTTNGTLMNDEIMSFIKDNINNISISIDGNQESHDLNRVFADGRGSYEKVITNAKKLLANNIDVRIRMTYSSNSVDKLCENIYSIADCGFTEIVPVVDYYDDNWNKNHINILNEEISKIIDRKKLYPDNNISLIELDVLNTKKGDCFGGVVSYAIDIFGNIYPCTISISNKDFIIGNVNDTQLDVKKIYELCKINASDNKKCLGCNRYEFCEGTRCKIINKQITGDYDIPPAIICASQSIAVKTTRKLKNIL